MKSTFLPVALIAGALTLAGTATADVLVDNFEDGNTAGFDMPDTTNDWSGATWAGPPAANELNRGVALRTGPVSFFGNRLNTSSKDAGMTTLSGNGVFKLGDDNGATTSSSYQINASTHNATAPERRFHSTGLSLRFLGAGAGDVFDATSYNYVRITAWRQSGVPGENITNAQFVVAMVADYLGGAVAPNQSSGPWNSDGSSLDGMAINFTPQAFLIPIKDTDRFKADPVLSAVSYTHGGTINPQPNQIGSSISNWHQLKTLNVGWRRVGAPAAAAVLGAKFYVDDIIFNVNPPGVTTTPDAPAEVTEGDTFEIQVVLDALPSHDVVIDVASLNTDRLTVTSGAQLTFPQFDWDVPQTVTLTAVDDMLINGDEAVDVTFTINEPLTDDLLYKNVTMAPVSVTVINNDFPTPVATLALATATSNEVDEDAVVFTVDLDIPAVSEVTVPFTISGTATVDDDYAFSPTSGGTSGEVVIAIGNDSGDITVTVADDAIFEGDETVIVTIGTPTNADLGTTVEQTLTIVDDEATPTFGFNTLTVTAAEEDTSIMIPVSLSGPAQPLFSVDFSTADDTALDGVDYEAASGTLEYNNLSTEEEITITLIPPMRRGGGNDVQFTITLENPSPFTTITPDEITVILQRSGSLGTGNWMLLD